MVFDDVPSSQPNLTYQGYHIFSLMVQMKELGKDGFGLEYEDMLNAQWNSIPKNAKSEFQKDWDSITGENEYFLTEDEEKKAKRERVNKKAQIISDTLQDMKILYTSFNTDFDKAYTFKINSEGYDG